MGKVVLAIRLVLALALALFGADKFGHFLAPPDAPPEGEAFLVALNQTGYIFQTIGAAFLLAAFLLIIGRVALAITIVAPITLNIILYHVTFDIAGIGPGAAIVLMQLVLFVAYRQQFYPMLGGSPNRE